MSKSVGNLKDSSLTPEVEFKLQDSGADFYLLCGQRLFPLRKQIAQRSPYLARSIRKNHRVHVVGTGAGAGQKYISGSALEKVLKLLYGGECNFQRGSQVLSLLESALLLEYNVPIFLLAGDIDSNFNDYEFFMVLEFSYRSGDQQLEKRCIRELIFHQFQQINYNRLGFLKSSRETAQKVLHLHRKLKNQGLIKGLTFSNLKEIIKDYNISNSTEINESILSPGCSSTIIEDENEDSEYVDATIKAQCSSAQACNEKDSDRPISPQNSSLLLVVDVMQKSQAEKLTSSRTQDLPLGQNREKQKCENSSLFNNQDLEGRSVRLKLRGQPHEDQLERSTSPTSECLLSSDIQLLQCPEGYQKLRPVRQSRQNSRKDLEIRGDPKERSSISLKTRRSMHSASKIFLSLDLKQIKYAPQFQTRDQFWEWD